MPISKLEFMSDPDKVEALVADRDAPVPPGKKPIGYKELEAKHGLPPRNGMNAYDVYHRAKGDKKETPLQAPRELVRRADVADVMPAGRPTKIDMYSKEVAYGRGWRAGCNFPELECPYPDEEALLAHTWMDGYDDGKKANRIVDEEYRMAEAKARRKAAHAEQLAEVA